MTTEKLAVVAVLIHEQNNPCCGRQYVDMRDGKHSYYISLSNAHEDTHIMEMVDTEKQHYVTDVEFWKHFNKANP